jgi:hypothetical protein
VNSPNPVILSLPRMKMIRPEIPVNSPNPVNPVILSLMNRVTLQRELILPVIPKRLVKLQKMMNLRLVLVLVAQFLKLKKNLKRMYRKLMVVMLQTIGKFANIFLRFSRENHRFVKRPTLTKS